MRYFEALLVFSKLLGVYQNYTILDVAAGWRYIHYEKRMHTCKIQNLSHILPAFINIAFVNDSSTASMLIWCNVVNAWPYGSSTADNALADAVNS